MINASGGSEDKLENGGRVFSDPFYSLTTQEEDIYLTFPFAVQFFVQFVLDKYVSASLEKENIERFVYREHYAPKTGRCLVLKNSNYVYFFSATNDNTKILMDEYRHFELNLKVFCCAFEVAISHHVSSIITGAFGLGVFRADAIVEAVRKFHNPSCPVSLDLIMAYYIRNPADSIAQNNYDIISNIFTRNVAENNTSIP